MTLRERITETSKEAEVGEVIRSCPMMMSVKELAKEKLTRIPERYIHPEIDPPFVSNTVSLPQVPVIDLAKLKSQDEKQPELQKLHLASQQWGFFQIINHGVNLELVEKMKKGAQELFDLPMEEKNKLWRKPGDMEGFGQLFEVSEQQKLNWADAFYIFTLPSHLRKPHLFSNLPLPFRENLEEYCVKVREVAMKILELMAEALGMELSDMKEAFKEGGQAMKINYYPPCPKPEDVIGVNAHTDGTALTILLQANEMDGLQIKKDGFWIPVSPLPDSFVVNIGDVLEIITNGLYRSIEHRAIISSEKERISIAQFYGPGGDGHIGPAPSLVNPERPALFKTVSVADYYKGFLTKEGPRKSYVDAMRINHEHHNIL